MHQHGWIKLYRCLLRMPIWKKSTPAQKNVLTAILLLASHAESNWEWQGQRFTVMPGQFITSLPSLANEAGATVQNVRSALKRFEKCEFLTDESTPTGRLITIVNWEKYQGHVLDPTDQATDSQKTANRVLTDRSTPIKNTKNTKNDKNETYNAFFEILWQMYPLKKGKGTISDSQKAKLYKIGLDEMTRCINRYIENKPDWQNFKNGSTFFKTGFIDYLDENFSKDEPANNAASHVGKQVQQYGVNL